MQHIFHVTVYNDVLRQNIYSSFLPVFHFIKITLQEKSYIFQRYNTAHWKSLNWILALNDANSILVSTSSHGCHIRIVDKWLKCTWEYCQHDVYKLNYIKISKLVHTIPITSFRTIAGISCYFRHTYIANRKLNKCTSHLIPVWNKHNSRASHSGGVGGNTASKQYSDPQWIF